MRRMLAVSVLCLATGALSGCPRGSQAEAPVVIGLIAYKPEPMGASFGAAMIQAATLAVQEVNDGGGLPMRGTRRHLKLAIEVGPATPESAVAAANRLINQENVAAIVGPHWSREALPVAEIAEQARVPLVTTGSTHPKTTEGRRYIFRIPFTDTMQGRVLATFARRDLRAETAAVLHDASDPYTTELSRIFSRRFRDLGGQIVATETYTPDARTDFGPQLQRIHARRPRVLLLPTRSDDAKVQVRQARSIGIGATVLGTDMWNVDDVNEDLDGAFFTRPERFHEQRFAVLSRAFGQAYGGVPGTEAVETYDAVGLLVAAMRFSGEATSESIRDGMYAMGPYQGVSGVIDYVDSGSPARRLTLYKVEGARAVFRGDQEDDQATSPPAPSAPGASGSGGGGAGERQP